MISVSVPVQLVSEPNQREHWAKRDRRRKEQQRAVYFTWRQNTFGKQIPKPPCTIKLTRFGPRLMDADNNVSSFKHVQDVVADLLGIDDGDTRVRFEYHQAIDSDYSVTIEVSGIPAC